MRQNRLTSPPPWAWGGYLKFLARSLGLILVAAGFVGLVIDGTRSIVNNTISFVTLEGTINALVPGGMAGLQQRERGGPGAQCCVGPGFQRPGPSSGLRHRVLPRRLPVVARAKVGRTDRISRGPVVGSRRNEGCISRFGLGVLK